MEVECLALRDLISPKKTKVDVDEVGGKHDQKENICVERRRTTPHKAEPIAAMLLNSRMPPTPELVHITPIKHPDRAHLHPEPWTPTANLKMLISAASPDIRDREMKKVLFRPIENEREKTVEVGEDVEVEVEDHCQFDVVEDGAEEDSERKPSRKQKSLGLLCQKFLALYPDYPASPEPINISLDEVATSLGVERRRIYDIVNVLESLMIVGRVAKNQYVWNGRQRLGDTLAELQGLGRQQRYHVHMEQAKEGRASESGHTATQTPEDGDSSYAAANKRKDKSLRIMSQKFVMLFLVSKTQTVTLDVAAKVLIEESQDTASHSKYKTKVRRLYDIANVLTSLGLIKKVHVREERGRKPAFKWIGPADFLTSNEDSEAVTAIVPQEAHADTHPMAALGSRKQKLARHASFSVVPTSVANQRRVNSAPSSPRRELTSLLPQPVDYSKKSVSNSAVCRLQFGNTIDAQPSTGLRTPTDSPLLHSPSLAPLAVPIHPESPYGPPPSPLSFSPHHHHHLAYLPSLSQPSVVMLYGGPTAQEGLDRTTEGQTSPREAFLGKRRRDDDDEEEMGLKRDRQESSEKRSADGWKETGNSLRTTSPRTSPSHQRTLPREEPPSRAVRDGEAGRHSPKDLTQPSHYLYVPNSAGLNSLNFLLSASQSPGSLTLPPGSMPTLAMPYVLVPSSALSSYPLMANGLQAAGADAPHTNLNFNMPSIMSPAHFVVSSGHFAVAGTTEFNGSGPALCSPEQAGLLGSGSLPPHSPLEPRQSVALPLKEPQTPLTPKEAVAVGGSKAFFQTPGTLGSAPVARRKGSAQRRLDIGHPPAN